MEDDNDDGNAIDNFDYILTFPTIRQGFIFDPIVFLFGWSGALDNNLLKYSKIYEGEGCITVRYIAPFDDCIARKGSYNEIGTKICNMLEEMELNRHPIILHVFGRNGSLVLNGFLTALQAMPDSDMISYNLKGVVFDR
uniref:Uncharacterized protein n=1 Tax=Plectus sambesii TaxID=2011161 RepID=A0A914X1Z9_9BILA